jgi:hypothetical protein
VSEGADVGAAGPGARARSLTRRDFGLIRVSERDLRLLGWIEEQYAVSLPQLAVLMGRSFHAARWLRARWQDAGWVEGRAVLVGWPVFVWLSGGGRRLAGGGYRLWRPNPARLAHIGAVNDVRLHVESREGCRWVCERQLARERRRRDGHLPDAVVELGAERHAIEVELVPKARARTQAIVADLLARFDAAVYFCAPAARGQLEELRERHGSRLVVRSLPTTADPKGDQ